jgi:hypothetical protein
MNWVRKSLRRLLDRWRPSLIVTQKSPKPATLRLKKIGAGLAVEAQRFGIPVRRVPEAAIWAAFGDGRRTTKFRIAQMLVERISFLAQTLPPLRKIYESQDYRLGMFAAVALALAFIAQLRGKH